jgi:hypothetical protein
MGLGMKWYIVQGFITMYNVPNTMNQNQNQNQIEKETSDKLFVERIAKTIFGKRCETGLYDHSGKYILNLVGRIGILEMSTMRELEIFFEIDHIKTYDDELSIVVELRGNAKQ